MGPILEEFKNKRTELVETVHKIFIEGLKNKNKNIPNLPLPQLITAQGGVGTSTEHEFLMKHYNLRFHWLGNSFSFSP